MKKKIIILNGPNLNLLGKREPDIYGHKSLEYLSGEADLKLKEWNQKKAIDLIWFQSNHEGDLIAKIQDVFLNQENYLGLIINPGGYSHHSIAIHDALKTLSIPTIEVHLSQIYKREEFRHELLTGRAVSTIMTGLGPNAYLVAIWTLANKLI